MTDAELQNVRIEHLTNELHFYLFSCAPRLPTKEEVEHQIREHLLNMGLQLKEQ